MQRENRGTSPIASYSPTLVAKSIVAGRAIVTNKMQVSRYMLVKITKATYSLAAHHYPTLITTIPIIAKSMQMRAL